VAETVQQYISRILSNVGGDDALAILESTPQRLEALVAGASADALTRRPVEGRWSAAQILAHMADAEVVGAWRFRTILAVNQVPIQAYDQNEWALAFAYEQVEPADSVALFAANRRATLALLRRVEPTRLTHAGLHAERGEESIDRLMHMYAGHDRNHLRQIEALLR
jgi:uncharacterized damage-inducible protein DinB